MIDYSKIGTFVAETMERLENEFGAEAELGDFLIITEIRRPSTAEERDAQEDEVDIEAMVSEYIYHSSDARGHVQLGLLKAAQIAAEERS